MPRKSSPARPKPKTVQAFTRRLLAWYARNARDLPWRKTRDAYRVIVSEFMLQQTQVSRVLEYYPRFLERFPNIGSLARARPKAVREAWEGLGYYARAANLHALARVVSETHDGVLPADPVALDALPGVGRYTAGAVACFAYEKAVPTVDTNVKRVVARVFAAKDVWEVATAILPKKGTTAWKLNQAMMELGALVCVARKPKCPACPVRSACRFWLTNPGRQPGVIGERPTPSSRSRRAAPRGKTRPPR
jgi:A/G-specific adenine glycosylase